MILTKAEEDEVSVALLAALPPAELMLLRAELRLLEAALAALDAELPTLDALEEASLLAEEAEPLAPAKMVVASEVVMVDPPDVMVVSNDEVVMAEEEPAACDRKLACEQKEWSIEITYAGTATTDGAGNAGGNNTRGDLWGLRSAQQIRLGNELQRWENLQSQWWWGWRRRRLNDCQF